MQIEQATIRNMPFLCENPVQIATIFALYSLLVFLWLKPLFFVDFLSYHKLTQENRLWKPGCGECPSGKDKGFASVLLPWLHNEAANFARFRQSAFAKIFTQHLSGCREPLGRSKKTGRFPRTLWEKFESGKLLLSEAEAENRELYCREWFYYWSGSGCLCRKRFYYWSGSGCLCRKRFYHRMGRGCFVLIQKQKRKMNCCFEKEAVALSEAEKRKQNQNSKTIAFYTMR